MSSSTDGALVYLFKFCIFFRWTSCGIHGGRKWRQQGDGQDLWLESSRVECDSAVLCRGFVSSAFAPPWPLWTMWFKTLNRSFEENNPISIPNSRMRCGHTDLNPLHQSVQSKNSDGADWWIRIQSINPQIQWIRIYSFFFFYPSNLAFSSFSFLFYFFNIWRIGKLRRYQADWRFTVRVRSYQTVKSIKC